jgi:hypothetical protein
MGINPALIDLFVDAKHSSPLFLPALPYTSDYLFSL